MRLTGDFDLTALLAPTGALNYGGYQDASAAGLLRAFRAADGAARGQAAGALYEYLAQEPPFAVICFKNWVAAHPVAAPYGPDAHPAERILSLCRLDRRVMPSGRERARRLGDAGGETSSEREMWGNQEWGTYFDAMWRSGPALP